MESPPARIRLLGELELRLGEILLPPLESARAESLLAFLLLHRTAPQPRQHLAFLLWPDSTEAQARTNLRHVLHTLRHALPDSDRFLAVTSRTLQWRAVAPFWLDVAAFEEALARAEEDAAEQSLAALREAVALYTGDLLQGHYDEWLQDERDRLRQRYLDALARLTARLEARHDYAAAIEHAERLLRHDSLHEENCRRLMRLHDARGDRARALRVYHVCAATLERELGVEPSAPTREAYEALLPPARQIGRIGGPPLVGRVVEWARLTALWRTTEGGRAQLVLVTGEPGIGKTRLIEEFRSWCVHRGAVTAEARSYPAEGALTYAPVVAWLRSDSLEIRRDRLPRGHLGQLARLLPELGVETPDLAPSETLPEDTQRLQLFDAVTRALLTAGNSLLLVADDVQWCDRESLQFLHYLLRAAPDARLLVAAMARLEEIDEHHPLGELLTELQRLERVMELPLARLAPDETAALAERITGQPLTPLASAQLFAETEGNPLFVIEALRAGWTRETAAHRPLPARVQAVIAARLAQLAVPARDLAGIAATIGREFTPDVLAHASGASEDALVRDLDELWRRRIVREQGSHAYDFSHDKIREVAYQALPPERRRRHHAAVALALERLHAGEPDAVGGQIASHWERAGQPELAIVWFQRAAEAAQQRHASADAANFLGRALDLLRMLPETTDRDVRELAILTTLPASLWEEGYASPRMADAHRRALELIRSLNVEPGSPLLRSLAIASLTRGDFAEANRLGAQLRERGAREADDVLLVEAAYVLGIAAFWQGEFASARRHFETAIDRYRPDHRRAHLLQYGFDPKVICLSRLGNTLWFLGHAAAATRARDAALVLAQEIGHPFSRAIALVFAGYLAIELRDLEGIRGYGMALAAERDQEAPQVRIPAAAFAAYIDVVAGRRDGIARIQHGLEETRGIEHAPGIRACIARVLLEACAAAGESRIGLTAADDALTAGSVTLWEAETRRQRALFLAALSAPWAEVEAELERALEVARRQGALALELRAVVSLLQLRRSRGEESAIREARATLLDLLGMMPEAEDTPERREARALLV